MSRIGKRPIEVPGNVKVEFKERSLSCSGPKGELRFDLHELVDLEIADGIIRVQADFLNNARAKAMMGTTQAVIQNMVTGVSEGFTRRLQLNGVGYRAAASGDGLELSLGFSKPVQFPLPKGVAAEVENNTVITLNSHDKVLLGQTCARIRALRPPEPYQGKGVRYEGERVRRKAGKGGKK